MQEDVFNVYKQTILKLLLSYYDAADSIRPYLALLSFIRNVFMPYHTQTNTPFILTPEILQNILAHSKEDILLMRYNPDAFNMLDRELQEELRRPISYIYNFLQTAVIIDSKLIVDYTLVDRLQAEMDSIVCYQPINARNSRPAKEQRVFRENVLEAYNYRCAITEQSIWIDNRVLLEAAHIIPYRDGGSFSINNGIALSYEMHKMFDNGLFGLYYDNDRKLRIKVSQSQRIRDSGGILQKLDNKLITMPQNPNFYPSDVAVQYSVDKLFA